MSLIAALEATSRQVRTYNGHYIDSLISILSGGGFFGIICKSFQQFHDFESIFYFILGSILVFQPSPWWDPRVIVPTVGMLIGNSISGPSVAVDRFLAIVNEQKHEIETRLCFGSTGHEAIVPTIRSSMLSGLLPTLNMMAVVGIVSIPGMMTGQLLGNLSI